MANACRAVERVIVSTRIRRCDVRGRRGRARERTEREGSQRGSCGVTLPRHSMQTPSDHLLPFPSCMEAPHIYPLTSPHAWEGEGERHERDERMALEA